MKRHRIVTQPQEVEPGHARSQPLPQPNQPILPHRLPLPPPPLPPTRQHPPPVQNENRLRQEGPVAHHPPRPRRIRQRPNPRLMVPRRRHQPAHVWLALAFSDHVHHAKAKAWFEAQNDASCGFCRVTRMALLRHLTNATIMGQFVQSQQDAWRHYDKLASDLRVVPLAEPSALEPAFRNFTQASSPSHASCRGQTAPEARGARRLRLVEPEG